MTLPLGSSAARLVGSSPTTRTKKKGLPIGSPFFLGSAAQRAAPPFGISNARGKRIAPAPRFCLRQNARTAQRRRWPEGRFASSPAAVSILENIDFNRSLHVGAKSALLLLSKSNPLRWTSIWYWVQIRKFRHLYCFDIPRHRGRHIVRGDFFAKALKSSVIRR